MSHLTPPPTRYIVRYGDSWCERAELLRCNGVESAIDPSRVEVDCDAQTLLAARAKARSIQRRRKGSAIRIYKRIDITDETPPEITWTTWWRWDEEFVEDYPR